jgi:hypothetical protein
VAHRLLKTSRLLHLYLGVFTVPAMLFFAITGGLQTFSLHETIRGSDYKPPAWLASVAQLHKKQTLVVPVRRPRPPDGAASAQPASGSAAAAGQQGIAPAALPVRPRNLLPMKIFFAVVSLSLLLSTLTGLYMAYKYSRKPRLVSGLLVAGIIAPVLLSFF